MRRIAVLAGNVAIAAAVAVPMAQQATVQPQPRANGLPAPGTGTPKVGRGVARPDGVLPKVPEGFTVSVAAELLAPRMMAYAPNGNLFVSSPAANRIWALRDANGDGVFETCGIFAEGPPPGAGRRGGGPPPTINYPAGCAPAAPPSPPAPVAAPATPQGVTPQPAAPQAGAPQAAPAPGRGAGAPPAAGNPGGGGGGRAAGPAILGANAPACTPPGNFVERGPGELSAPFGLAFNDGYLYVGNTASIVRYKYANGDLKAQATPEKLMNLPGGRPHDTQHRLQPRGHEDVRRGRLAVEQRRRRGLPPRRDSRVQSGWHRLSASSRPASATPSASHWQPNRTSSGRR